MYSSKVFQALSVCLLGLVYLCNSAVIDYSNPVVQTNSGQIRGKPYTWQTTGTSPAVRQVVEFIGIPYARPPTGYDRFRVSHNNFPIHTFLRYETWALVNLVLIEIYLIKLK